MDNIYFAAKPANDLAQILSGKSDVWFRQLENNRYLDKIRRMWHAYHGASTRDLGDGHKITFGGEQGELTNISINHFRNLAEHMLVMVTATRPSMQARASNTDYKSVVQTKLADGLLDYYMREKRLEIYLKKAVEYAIVLGAGFIKMDWNPSGGEQYDFNKETNTFQYEGDAKFVNLSPWDVIFDSSKESQDHDWVLVRTFKNRYDVAARYPEYKDEILSVPTKSASYNFRFMLNRADETDDIAIYEFFHRKTDSMPDGRYLIYIDNKMALSDTPIPYRRLPVYRISPSDILGTPYGYTPMFDILPIQEAVDSLYGAVLSNNVAFAVQNIWIPSGANLSISQLSGGLNLIESNPQLGKPEAIQLTNSSPETYKLIETLERTMETLSGVNSVARGNPAENLESGTALALVQSMALQFISGLQQSYVQLIEDVGTGLIEMLRDFADVPRVAAIVGKDNRTYMKEFNGDDLNKINRVIVDVGNPLSRTTAGRVQMAEQLLQMKLLNHPEQYFQVISTGKLDVMTDGINKQLLLIKSENEELVGGEEVVHALSIEDHKLHIQEHAAVLSDSQLKRDPELVSRVLAHIQEHIDLARSTDPGLLGMLNIQPLAPVGAPGPSPDQNAPPAGPMGEIPDNMQNPQSAGTPASPEASGINMPNLPKPPGEFKNNPVLAQDIAPQ